MDGTMGPGTLEQFAQDKPSDAKGAAKWRSILVGEETLLGECAAMLQANGHEIVAVVASEGAAAQWAQQANVRHLATWRDLLGADIDRVDYLFSISNLSVLPREVLSIASRAAINFHDGPLPAYAGLNTPVWALLAGEREHGITWHMMTATVDGGDVLATQVVPIDPGETALSLNTKCFEAALRSFEIIARDVESAVAGRQPQIRPAERSFRRGDRPPSVCTIDWSAPAEDIARLVHALNFGPYRNPVGVAKSRLNGQLLHIEQVTPVDSCSGMAPGTIVYGGAWPVVATGTRDLKLVSVAALDGQAAGPDATSGDRFESIGAELGAKLGVLDSAAAVHEGWWADRLRQREGMRLPQFEESAGQAAPEWTVHDHDLSSNMDLWDKLAAMVAYLGRVADRDVVEIGYADPAYAARLGNAAKWFAPQLPLRVVVDWNAPLSALQEALQREFADCTKRVAIPIDLIARTPELRGRATFGHPVAIEVIERLEDARIQSGTTLHIALSSDGASCRFVFNAREVRAEAVEDLWRGFGVMLESLQGGPRTPLGEVSLLTAQEHDRVVHDWNATQANVRQAGGIHLLFGEQAGRTPDRPAITSRGCSLSYAELDARSNRMARYLSTLGVAPGARVGLNVERSCEMVVALLAIHKAGGAYVPLDPNYPRERLANMILDSGLTLIVTQSSLASSLPSFSGAVVSIDEVRETIDAQSDAAFDGGARGEDLAYVIYTSGSTGHPKGVMVEHRNVLNFFAGMDGHLEDEGVWLAVTSLSFDISVLELFWPLTRGYHVVIATDREVRGDVPAAAGAGAVDFSLFYFASSDSGSAAEQYQLLLDGAKFADANGFAAVWTPERHFHPFGGPYPNPAVAAAALATITSRIAIRAGSVVGTLHHPIRIAEEWAFVDNISNGRVGIAFASGWQPNDFVLAPENFRDRSGVLAKTIDDVRGLWRGESRAYAGPLGTDVSVTTYPRPVQAELPCWITAAGNPETFAEAGRIGANLLTHMLGQSVDELAQKIATYRTARRNAGHQGNGHVTLMLHTFVGDDAAAVRDIVRKPLIEYLRTSTNLLKQHAWSFPAFKRPPGSDSSDQIDLSELSAAETDALLEHSFDRYFETSGLFGTPQQCSDFVSLLRSKGVNEIGCLIDFGVAPATVLKHLPALNRLRQLVAERNDQVERPLPALMEHYGVTHLQGTPSLLQVLESDERARPKLAKLRRLMVGGEPFPPRLASALSGLVAGSVMNLYGPTETTIWSAVHELADGDSAPPLGRPLANQQIYILDRRGALVRPGTPGELVIGGDGVVRGYHERPELTAERFVADPVDPARRAYRTGDLARQRPDGTLEFLGRLDHQVKIRGYRIELGEIEATLAAHPQVVEVVVVGRGDDAEARLVAYIVPRADPPSDAAMREHLREHLPEFMIPSAFVAMKALPHTPNGKIDRGALPEPSISSRLACRVVAAEPVTQLEAQIQSVWCDVLKLPQVGLRDNFFDIGGHSLLAVQLHRRLNLVSTKPLALTDIFRFPTVSALSAHLAGEGHRADAARGGNDRARARRAAFRTRSSAPSRVRV